MTKKLNARLVWVDPTSCIFQHETDPKKVKTFVHSHCYGAIFPPVHLAEYDGRYLIVDGHHRTAAALHITETLREQGWLREVQALKALVVDGAEFDELDCDLQSEGLGNRADMDRYWPKEGEYTA